ncbi:MAG TPA: SMP-30/gluconolactonase/LRE family protein [Longimicrobium sp.]|jgi:hypothetical protein
MIPLLRFVAILAFACVPAAAHGQLADEFTRIQVAYRAGDLPALLAALRSADRLAPGHPVLLFHLARTSALLGDTGQALAALERLAPLGRAAPLEDDSAFAGLRGSTRFRALAGRLAASAEPRVRSDTLLVTRGEELYPESVAWDARTRTFFLGSLVANKVVRILPDGTTRDFAVAGPPGRVIGIRADASRRRLWVTTTPVDTAAPRTPVGVGGWTELHAYHLDSGRLLRRLKHPDPREPQQLNDLVVTARGEVLVNDGIGNAVYRVPARGGTLVRVFGGDAAFTWPNGMALSADERRLYVAHAEGLSAIDLRTGRRTLLPRPPGTTLATIDGMYLCGGSLLAIQRLSDFEQVIRIRLAPARDAVTAVEVLERRHPAYEQPTTGVMVGGELVYIANSRYTRLRPDGTAPPGPGGTVLLRLPCGPSPGSLQLPPSPTNRVGEGTTSDAASRVRRPFHGTATAGLTQRHRVTERSRP